MAGWLVTRPGPTPAERLAAAGRIDLVQAQRVLTAEARILAQGRHGALDPEDQSQAAALAGLQSQSADLVLEGLVWRSLPPQGARVPIEMELRVTGQFYDLPILVDGLFRQAWPVEVLRIEVETPKLDSATVNATLLCRFHRAARPDEVWIRQEADGLFQDDPGGADALVQAARVHLLSAFADDAKDLSTRSQRNRELVMMHLPSALHQLPQSPMGWVELTVDGEQVSTRLEP